MVKIWAKIYTDKKIVRDLVYTKEEPFAADKLFVYLSDICEAFDEPTPVLLQTHVRHFLNFNNVRITASHFVERVNFDYLQLENIA